MDPIIGLAIVIPIVSLTGGGLIWGLRLEGRVNTSEQVAEVHHEDITNRLKRIERKLDKQNGDVSDT